MSWASKKKLKYASGFILIILLIVFAFTYKIIFKKPTCSDGKLNGTETGIDCGGSCSLMCKEDVVSPVILWSRAFPVVENNYNLVAMVENRNKNSGVVSASYEFRVYDTNNKLLGRKEGKTFIPPNQQFAVFESRFNAGESSIKSVAFEFTGPIIWIKKAPTLQNLPISINNIVFNDDKDNPNLSATIINNSIYDLPEFDVIAILYDVDRNAINASKTHKGGLSSNNKTLIIFTWPELLSAFPATKDILISINPFSVSY